MSQFECPGFSLDMDASPKDLPEFSSPYPAFHTLLDTLELSAILQTAESLEKNFEAVLVIGIGGSHLGGETLVSALGNGKRPFFWLSNIDPPAIQKALEFCRRYKTATLVISKSGSTLETLAAFFHLSPYVDTKGIVAITDPKKGELRRLASQNHWKSLEIPENLGGRFSVLSAVGLLPAALAGLSIEKLLSGAKEQRQFLDASTQNPAAALAKAKFDWDQRGYSVQYLMPYWSSLSLFAHWYVQLWAESLGKLLDSNPTGPNPVAALGTRDQHSLLQSFQEGTRNKIIGFMDILHSTPEMVLKRPSFKTEGMDYLFDKSFSALSHLGAVATRRSLQETHIPTYCLTVSQLNEETLGGLVYFFEAACALSAQCYQVNAFDQPGVERTKTLWKKSLQT